MEIKKGTIMKKHQYCCQNTAQNYLEHIIPVPDDFNINPACLNGIGKQEFIAGLRALTDILRNIYADMIQNPSEYGFPLVDDIVYSPHNPKAAESQYAPFRVITILYILTHTGELSDDGIIVNKQAFSEMCKAKRPVYFKLSNTKMIFQKLHDFGFTFDNYVLSYPDNNNVIRALYGYMKNTALKQHAILSLNYYLAISPVDLPADFKQTIFAKYLSGIERELYIWLNDTYIKSGFYCSGGDFDIAYHVNAKEKKRALRCMSQNGNLTIECKLYHIGDYSEIIEKMHERYKRVFGNVKDCSIENCLYKRESCVCRVDYTIDGQFYKACTFERFFSFNGFQPEDIEFFKHIFSHEAAKQQQIKTKK